MGAIILVMLALSTSVALADEADDARRLAVSGRDAYWNCLAREYPRDSNRTMSEQDFGAMIASACPSERQNFRVVLVDYLRTQFADSDAGMTTANNAIALAQKDIVAAFARRKAAAK